MSTYEYGKVKFTTAVSLRGGRWGVGSFISVDLGVRLGWGVGSGWWAVGKVLPTGEIATYQNIIQRELRS